MAKSTLRSEFAAVKTEVDAALLKKQANAAIASPRDSSARKMGLRAMQIRVLRAMAHADAPLSKQGINDMISSLYPDIWVGDTCWQTGAVGALTPEDRVRADARNGYTSLLTLGYVEHYTRQVERKQERVFMLTTAGREALGLVAAVGGI